MQSTQRLGEFPIEPDWLARPSTEVAPDLIGCTLQRRMADGSVLQGLIVETEAYTADDPACHAYRRRTLRNSAMFGPAGSAYVYLIYGIYHCLNIVTDVEGVPSAVLIRALWLPEFPPKVAGGPGKLCKVLEIDRTLNGVSLTPENGLWLEHRSSDVVPPLIQTTRIGLTQGADLPWRWYLADCPAVSRLVRQQ